MTEILEADVVVVGAGVHGSSAALHLARAGRITILLDQFPLPHSRGSSHGQSRIIRQANYGIPALTTIMTDAVTHWRRIQDQAGETLIRPSSMLLLAEGHQRALMERVANSVKQGGHQPLWLTPQHVNHKYGVKTSPDSLALLDPSAGVLMADKCVAALQRLFREAGGRIVDTWPVDDVQVAADETVRVTGRRGVVKAEAAVLCPGPWAGPLLAKLGVHIPLRVEKISVFYWRIKDPANNTTTTTIFVDLKPSGHFYGLPELEYPGLMKLVLHTGPEVQPDQRDQVNSEKVKEAVKKYVKEKFPFLHPEPALEESCMYTWTPDEEFVVDRHPKHKNIVFCCGFSGTGFKIAPTIGENLCRLVLGHPTLHDLSAFSASRFSPRSKM
ncbi:peroxisomal sarcosine oxidase-like [Homarus americanus]|uniref:peroxisomal sarcosine oxidase-like n=1 Tax=Homarus americanus TaxID=6706 RepID=UPI001C46BAC3|nr:peroxisomal sarcosine oxidase-like [Homarus americanus]